MVRYSDSTSASKIAKTASMLALSTIRKAATWFALVLLGAVLGGTVSEWFIHVAEDKGWYDNAGATWDRLMSWLISLFTSPYMVALAIGATCFAAGMWIDYVLYRRERAPIEAAMDKAALDRQKLSREAMKIGKSVCALAADGDAKQRVAWEADSARMMGGAGHSRESSAREQQIVIETYAKEYAGEVWRIIDASARILHMDASGVWRLSHGVNGIHDLHEIGRFLISIANELRFPGNPVLPDTRELERQQYIREQAAVPQLPPSTGQETPQ